jgi:transcription antitermination factor NusG
MATTQVTNKIGFGLAGDASVGQTFDRPEWYAVYANVRHEKRVKECLDRRMVECYLPSYRSVRRWLDRRKEVELPLFPGYLFVRIAYRSRLQVLTVPGIVHIVSFDGRPAPICEDEIEVLRQALSRGTNWEPHPYLKVGRRVRIRNGPLCGVEGTLVRRKEGYRLIISIELIMRSVATEVDEADVEPIS